MTARIATFAAAISVLFIAAGASAHHSDAMYDLERMITLEGVLTRVVWSNPHVLLEIEVTAEAGETVRRVIELSGPGALLRNGLSQDSFVLGEHVAIEGHPAVTDEGIHLWGRSLTRPDGTVLMLPAKANYVGAGQTISFN